MSMTHQIHIPNHMKKEVALDLILKSMGTTKRKDIDKDHEYTTKHSEEENGIVMKEKNPADHQAHGSYEKHEKASEHKEEGSGMR